jgi:hypothetical protein
MAAFKYRMLTETEVSEWLQIPVATLRSERSRPPHDPLPFVRLGRSVRYPEDQILKWIERNTHYKSPGHSVSK